MQLSSSIPLLALLSCNCFAHEVNNATDFGEKLSEILPYEDFQQRAFGEVYGKSSTVLILKDFQFFYLPHKRQPQLYGKFLREVEDGETEIHEVLLVPASEMGRQQKRHNLTVNLPQPVTKLVSLSVVDHSHSEKVIFGSAQFNDVLKDKKSTVNSAQTRIGHRVFNIYNLWLLALSLLIYDIMKQRRNRIPM